MLKLLFLLAVGLTACLLLALMVLGRRNRHRRRLSRSHRVDDYAERRSQWHSYLSLNQSRRNRRLTDQRESDD